MKIAAFLICTVLLFSNFCSKAQTLLSYGNSNVSKQEFIKAFSKNNTDQHPTEKAYRDYLELYIRFKLKVKAAYDLKMDTLPNQKAELNDFRRQIEQGFLTDENSFKDIVNEAFVRSRKDIHLAHIYIAFDSSGNNKSADTEIKDTAKAWKLAMTVYHELEKGADFGKLASLYSSDVSSRLNKGDIGYLTLFTLPYSLENLAYSTPLGKFSKPFRSKAGYHIFKNLGERKAAGKVKAAHIVLTFPPDTANNIQLVIKQKADSIYNALLQGASFNEMVDRYSNDYNALAMHGEMPEFGVGSFDPGFENVVFGLNKNGAFTKPILTPVGYYIIKRLKQIPVNDDPLNDSAMSVLKQQVRNDSRIETARKAMSQKILKTTGFKKSLLPESTLLKYVENTYFNKKNAVPPNISDKTILFSFPHQQNYIGDFIKYLQASRYNQSGSAIQNVLTQYEEIMMRQYYRDHLQEYNPDFASQLKEFKEGNLLFEIMQHNVWDKASTDSTGLKAFFENNKNKYWWESSADAIIFSCTDSLTAYDLKRKLDVNIKGWKDIVSTYETKVQTDSGRFELSQLPMRQFQTPVSGQFTGPLKNVGDNNTSLLYFIRQYPQKQPRNFEDAKGFVLNDYQTFLENKWIAELKNKYPVKINETVFRSLLK
jgi:peptidyl-prolyl cis-trans isomerase SurA